MKRSSQIRGRSQSTENVERNIYYCRCWLRSRIINIYVYWEERKARKEGRVDGRDSRTRGRRVLFFSLSLFFFFIPGAADSRIEEWEFRGALHEKLCLRILHGSRLCNVDPRMRVRVKSMQTDARRDASRDFLFWRVFSTDSCISYVLLLREYTSDI